MSTQNKYFWFFWETSLKACGNCKDSQWSTDGHLHHLFCLDAEYLIWKYFHVIKAELGGSFQNSSVRGCPNKCLTPILFSMWHLWWERLEHESQILPVSARDCPELNAWDPSMRNSPELSAEIKLICQPQATTCKSATNMNTLPEIGLLNCCGLSCSQSPSTLYVNRNQDGHLCKSWQNVID